jgi:hypothetical protein
MSFVSAVPDVIAQAAEELDRLGSTLSAANAAAAAATTGMAAPAADEVSAAIASLLNTHAQEYQSLSAQAATFHSQFVGLLNAGAGSYASTEIANTHAAASSDISQFFGDGPLSTLLGAETEYIQLPLDAVGPVITSTTALGQSGTTFLNAVLAGNPGAAMAALRDAGPSVGSAFLYGHNTVSVPLPSDISGTSLFLNIPFGGVLADVQPITVTVTFGGDFPDLAPFTIPFPMEVGGIIPEVQANGPSVALALLLLPLLLAGSVLGG